MLYELCILGLGYVGLPTAMSLTNQGRRVLGVDISQPAGRDQAGEVDLLDADRGRLGQPCARASSNSPTIRRASARLTPYMICVPTPIDHHLIPDLGLLRGACELVVEHARAGQTMILTSTTYVGTTRDC